MSAEISIKKATLINACAKYSNVLFMLVANAVLARLLSAEEYGILAIITVFVTFFQLFSDMGFSSGVIQNKELTGEDISNIFSFTLYFGVVLGFLFFILSFFIAQIYQNKVFVPIGAFLSIAIFFSTANMIPSAQLMRDKQFIVAATRSIAVNIVSYVIAIILAFHNFSFYSLVAQSVIAAILNFCWNYSTTKIGFKVVFEIKSIRKIFSYSAYNFLYEFVNYFGRNLDNLLTGKYMGSQTLGYYNKAYQLMLYPVNYLTNVITPVLHPILSDYQDNKEYIYKMYLKVLKCLSLLGVFASVICTFCAEEIVLILYGSKWIDTIPCIMVLGASVWFQMITATCTSIFKSLGESKLRFNSGLLYAGIQILMVIGGVASGNIVVLSGYVAASFVLRFFIEHYFLIHNAFGKSQRSFYKKLLPELLMAMILSIAMKGLNSVIKINNCILSFTIKVSVCFIIYIGLIIATGQQKYILPLLPQKIRGRLPFHRMEQ